MTSIKNHKTLTALVAIAALASVLVVSTSVLTGHIALADDSKVINNKGVNVPTDTDQKSNCETAGGTSAITTSCDGTSTNSITQSGGVLHK